MHDVNIEHSAFNDVLQKINEFKEKLTSIEFEKNPNSPKRLTFWFRGVSNFNYKLTPSLYRMDFESAPDPTPTSGPPHFKIPTDKELILLRAFFAREHFESLRGENVDPKEIELTYAKMQHYGAPTRLIDWTESFGTALFFATNDNPDTDGGLYITSPELIESEFSAEIEKYGFKHFVDNLRTELYKNPRANVNHAPTGDNSNPFAYGRGYFDIVRHPKFTNPRILAQRGHFTFTIAPPETIPDSQSIGFIKISKENKQAIKHFLAEMNIDEYTIYPDIIGLASYVKSAANLNPRKEFDAIRYFSEPDTEPANNFFLKRSGKRTLEEVDVELFRETHRSILSDAIYNKGFVEKAIKNNIENEDLCKKVLSAFDNLGKRYLGNIIFPFHLQKRAESFVCEIIGRDFPKPDEVASGPALEYHHSSGLGSFDRFTTGINLVPNSNGPESFFKKVITIKNPSDLIQQSISRDFIETRFHRFHSVCAPHTLTEEILRALFSSMDGVRKVAILIVRLSNLPPENSNIVIRYHPSKTDRPGMTYRACNRSSDLIIFLTANRTIPRPFSTFGLYLENEAEIAEILTTVSTNSEQNQFPAEDLLFRIRNDQSNFLREIGELVGKSLRIKFGDEAATTLLSRADLLDEIVEKCRITDNEAKASIDKIGGIVKQILSGAEGFFKNLQP